MSKDNIIRQKTFSEINKYDFCNRYLTVLNSILPDNKYLSQNEIKLLSVLLSLDDPIHVHNRFNTTARKIARDKLHFTLSTITNTIKTLRDKNAVFINPETGILTITAALTIPQTDSISINITVTKINDHLISLEDGKDI